VVNLLNEYVEFEFLSNFTPYRTVYYHSNRGVSSVLLPPGEKLGRINLPPSSSPSSFLCQYVRVKRKNQTVFLYADPGEKIIDVKRKLAKINEKSLEDLGLLFNDTKLENDMTVGDYKIENDNVIFMVYKKPDSEAYEEVDIHKTSASEDGSEVKE